MSNMEDFELQRRYLIKQAKNVYMLKDLIGKIIADGKQKTTSVISKILDLHSKKDYRKVRRILRDFGYSPNTVQLLTGCLL